MKRMRRRIVLLVLAAIVIALAVFAFTQKENLHAAVMSFRYTDEELRDLQTQAEDELLESIGLDRDWLEHYSDGALSPSGSETGSDPSVVPHEGNAGSSAAPAASPGLPKEAQRIVYSLYSLQSLYTGQLDGIRAEGIAEFEALPSSEKTTSSKFSIAKSCVSKAFAVESQCDAKVSSLLQELRTILRKNGLDESVANQLDDYYATQKGLIKAEYIRKYNKYLK